MSQYFGMFNISHSISKYIYKSFLKDLHMNFSFCLIFLFTFVLYVLNTFQGLSLM